MRVRLRCVIDERRLVPMLRHNFQRSKCCDNHLVRGIIYLCGTEDRKISVDINIIERTLNDLLSAT